MSLWGWLILGMAVGGTTGFLAWCLLRVLGNQDKNHLHATTDLDPRQTDREPTD